MPSQSRPAAKRRKLNAPTFHECGPRVGHDHDSYLTEPCKNIESASCSSCHRLVCGTSGGVSTCAKYVARSFMSNVLSLQALFQLQSSCVCYMYEDLSWSTQFPIGRSIAIIHASQEWSHTFQCHKFECWRVSSATDWA